MDMNKDKAAECSDKAAECSDKADECSDKADECSDKADECSDKAAEYVDWGLEERLIKTSYSMTDTESEMALKILDDAKVIFGKDVVKIVPERIRLLHNGIVLHVIRNKKGVPTSFDVSYNDNNEDSRDGGSRNGDSRNGDRDKDIQKYEIVERDLLIFFTNMLKNIYDYLLRCLNVIFSRSD